METVALFSLTGNPGIRGWWLLTWIPDQVRNDSEVQSDYVFHSQLSRICNPKVNNLEFVIPKEQLDGMLYVKNPSPSSSSFSSVGREVSLSQPRAS